MDSIPPAPANRQSRCPAPAVFRDNSPAAASRDYRAAAWLPPSAHLLRSAPVQSASTTPVSPNNPAALSPPRSETSTRATLPRISRTRPRALPAPSIPPPYRPQKSALDLYKSHSSSFTVLCPTPYFVQCNSAELLRGGSSISRKFFFA